jgi:hypothetical protein
MTTEDQKVSPPEPSLRQQVLHIHHAYVSDVVPIEALQRLDDQSRAANGLPPGGPLSYLFQGFRDPPKKTLAEKEADHPEYYQNSY